MENFILKSDSYKPTHWKQYPYNTSKICSYLESRGGNDPNTLFCMLQYILKRHFEGVQITKDGIDEAEAFFAAHFGRADLFNRKGWDGIIKQYGGVLPLRIKAVKEGSIVPVGMPLMTIENTDPNCYWLTNYAETLLMNIWYPITVATNSYYCKQIIKKYLEETHGDITSLPFKLHDFGMRGVSCYEQGAIGAAAHLINFMGTDTISGIQMLNKYYGAGMCGFSIPASEHSTMTSWGKDNELEAYKNMLKQYPDGLVACVIDSWDAYNACDKLYGELLRDDVMKRNGTIVLRPDSGNPVEVNNKIIHILWNKFGGTFSKKGYKVLDPHVRIIQGDGIDRNMIGEILQMYKNNGFSTENIAFGSGGGLLQKFDRDTYKFAIKCSYAEIDGKPVNVYKDPITSKSKVSKKGQLKLHKSAGHYMTISSAENTPQAFNSYTDELETVFENGNLVREQSLDEIRNLSNQTQESL
jgi:nicotinamide phosphoribosyltransferase